MRVLDVFTIQVLVPEDGDYHAIDVVQMEMMIAEIEENLTDLLPDRCEARIRRWDHPDPDEGNDDE